VPLGIEPTGPETTAGEGAFPDLAEQRVVDVLMGDGGEEDQTIGVVETQGLHMALMPLKDLEEVVIEGDDAFFACFGG